MPNNLTQPVFMLTIASVTFDRERIQEPPAPADTPPAVRAAMLEAVATQPKTVVRSGASMTRPIRFASAESYGWVDYSQKIALMILYLSGEEFTVTTDLLGVRNVVRTFYGCFFDPAAGPPVFGPHPVVDGDHYHYDFVLRMPLSGA
jgi:hypothetical protein